MRQKFFKGDLVRIAKHLPSDMAHFHGEGKLAIVQYSYRDEYGRTDGLPPDYALVVKGFGYSAWWPENLLKLVKRRGRCQCCGQDVPHKFKESLGGSKDVAI